MSRVRGSGGGAEAGAAGASAPARLRAWLAVAAWILLIAVLSQGTFSAELTGSRLAALLQFLGIGLEHLDEVHLFVRKGAHLGLYGGLGLLAARAARLSLDRRLVVPVAFALALAVSGSDELHQAGTPGRTGSPRDVALDLLGAGLGIGLWIRR